jgi:hypothetical protein
MRPPPSLDAPSSNGLADMLVGSLLVEHERASVFPVHLLGPVAALCGTAESDMAHVVSRAESRLKFVSTIVENAAVSARPLSAGATVLYRRLHYVPHASSVASCGPKLHASPRVPIARRCSPSARARPSTAASRVPGRDFASKESPSEAISKELLWRLLSMRRHFRVIAERVPALERLREARELDIVSDEAGQREFFDEVFAMMDVASRGAVREDEFVAFGQRVGCGLAQVFTRRVFRMALAARRAALGEAVALTRDDFRALLFPPLSSPRRLKLPKEHLRVEAAAAPRGQQLSADTWEELGGWSAEEAALVRCMFAESDTDKDGLVCAVDLAKFVLSKKYSSGTRRPNSAEFNAAVEGFEAQIAAFLRSKEQRKQPENLSLAEPHCSCQLTIWEFAAMQKPIFEYSSGLSPKGSGST